MTTANTAQEQRAQVYARTRWLLRRDMPAVLDIEQRSFTKPWSGEDLCTHLNRRTCIGKVAEVEGNVVAFCIYDLHNDHLQLVDLAVHPDYRGRGIGEKMIRTLQEKLGVLNHRTHIVALVPESCRNAQPFLAKYGIHIRPTKEKGILPYMPVLSTMATKDVEEVQSLENAFMRRYGKEPRNVGEMIANNTRYGIVARDMYSGELLGYTLYARELSGIDVSGEYGVIVYPRCRKRGIGRMLMMALIDQQLPLTVSDIYLLCEDQVGFLRAMGVPVPDPQLFATVKWEPRPEVHPPKGTEKR